MIRAVVFDCFGVLTSEGWIPFRDKYFGTDAAKMDEANSLMRELATGELADEDFQKDIGVLAGVPTEKVWQCLHDNLPDMAMFAYIQKIKPQYKTAMLSNVGQNRLHEIFSAEQLALIDIFALSSETGYVKPDPRAYSNVAEQLGVLPAECVFVDDQPHYVEGGQAAGMHTVQFVSAEQSIADLERLLSV